MTQQESVNLLVEVAKRGQKAGILELEEAYLVAIAVNVLKTPIPVLPSVEVDTTNAEPNVNNVEVVEPQEVSTKLKEESKVEPLSKV